MRLQSSLHKELNQSFLQLTWLKINNLTEDYF